MRVCFTSDLSPPWYLLGGLWHSHLFLSLGPLVSPSRSYGFLPYWVLSSLKHPCVDIPTTYLALGNTVRFVFCIVGNPRSSVNTGLLVSSYRRKSFPCGTARRVLHSLLTCSVGTVSILTNQTRCLSFVFLLHGCLVCIPSPTSHSWIRLDCTATPLHGWHPTAPLAGTWIPGSIAGTYTADWVSSPGGFPHPHHTHPQFTLLSHTWP